MSSDEKSKFQPLMIYSRDVPVVLTFQPILEDFENFQKIQADERKC